MFIFRSIQPNLLSSSSLLIGSWHRTAPHSVLDVDFKACMHLFFVRLLHRINQSSPAHFFIFFMKAGLSGLCEGMEGREGLLLV